MHFITATARSCHTPIDIDAYNEYLATLATNGGPSSASESQSWQDSLGIVQLRNTSKNIPAGIFSSVGSSSSNSSGSVCGMCNFQQFNVQKRG